MFQNVGESGKVSQETGSMRDVDKCFLQEVSMLTTEPWPPGTQYSNIVTLRTVLKIGNWNVRKMNQTRKWKK